MSSIGEQDFPNNTANTNGNGKAMESSSNSGNNNNSNNLMLTELRDSTADTGLLKRSALPIANMGHSDDCYCLQLDVEVPLRAATMQPHCNLERERSRRSASVRSASAQSQSGDVPLPPASASASGSAAARNTQTQTDNHSASVRASVSQQSSARFNALVVAEIGTEVLRQTGAYPGFRQLQKLCSHSQSNSNMAQLNSVNDATTDDTRGAATISRQPSKVSIVLLDKEDNTAAGANANASANVKGLAISNEYNTVPNLGQLIPPTPSVNEQFPESSVRSPLNAMTATNRSKPKSVTDLRQPEIGYRLGRRKKLYEKRRRIADYTLCCAVFGIVIAVIEMEATLSTANVYVKNGTASLAVKSIVTLSTLVLLALEIMYHVVEIKLFCIDNCIEDWRVAIDFKRVILTSCKLLICSIHPFPGAPNFVWSIDLRGVTHNPEVSLDVVLTLPMFLRLYLIFRVMLLHSKLFTDASSRSIGAMNRIKFNIRFVLKTLMTLCPGTVLLVLILSLLIVASWSIRVCEGQHKSVFLNMLNSLWFISITFMSIGYGDIYPDSICGRLIAIFTGMMGSGCMALVVAVVARKLELTRAEKHVHNFMMDNQLTKSLRSSAANVLRETWLIYKYTKLAKRINPYKVRYHQRKFFDAIQALRKVKLDQRKLADHTARLVDLPKLHHQLHDTIMESHSGQRELKDQVQLLSQRMQVLESMLTSMPQIIASQIVSSISNQRKLTHQCAAADGSAVECDALLKTISLPVSRIGAHDSAGELLGNESPNSLLLTAGAGATTDSTAPAFAQAKVIKLDAEDRLMSRQSSSASQPARRMLKLAEMPETFKSHSAV